MIPEKKTRFPILAVVVCCIAVPIIFVSFMCDMLSIDETLRFSGLCNCYAQSKSVFSVNVDKQKQDIEKAFDKLQEQLSALKFQDMRSTIDLVEHKINKIKKELSSEEISSFTSKVDKMKKSMEDAEDSLVNKSFEILQDQGADAALQFTANDLKIHGVSEKKIASAEKKILKEGPSLRQSKDKETIDRLVKLLESGQKPEPNTDRFLLQSARRIVKARADSIKTVEDAKNRKEMKERKEQEKNQQEQETKEKKLEEERQASIKKEEEKKRSTEELGFQKQLQIQREKARKDSIEEAKRAEEQREALKKEGKRRLEEVQFTKLRKKEDESIQKWQTKSEKSRGDNITGERIEQELIQNQQQDFKRRLEEEKEKQRQAQIEEDRQRKINLRQQAILEEKARKDSIEAYRNLQDQLKQQEKERRAQLAREKKEKALDKSDFTTQNDNTEASRWGQSTSARDKEIEDKKEQERLARLIEEERQKKLMRDQQLIKQVTSRQDSMEATPKKQEQLDNQRRLAEERKLQQAQLEQERRIAEEQRKQEQLDNQRRITEERKMQAQLEKERRMAEQQKRDQENQRWGSEELKERDRFDRIEQDRNEKLASRQEKALKSAVDEIQPIKEDMEQDEIQRLLQNVRKEKERLTRLEQQLQQQILAKQEQARQDSAVDSERRVKLEHVKRITAPKEDPEARRRILANDEERRRQLLALQEKARLDYQEKLDEEREKLERNRRKRLQARQESMRQNNSYSSGKKVLIQVDVDKDAAKYDQPAEPGSQQTSRYFSSASTPEETKPVSSQRDYSKSAEQALKVKDEQENAKLKEKRKSAEKLVADIYKLLEKTQVNKAKAVFERNREFLVQYTDSEVFSLLDQSITSSAAAKASETQGDEESSQPTSRYEAKPKTTLQPSAPIKSYSSPLRSSASSRSSKDETAMIVTQDPDITSLGGELESISRINGFVRDNNGKAAYMEFKKVEEQLKNYFTTEEFKHFKSMVENAYKSRND